MNRACLLAFLCGLLLYPMSRSHAQSATGSLTSEEALHNGITALEAEQPSQAIEHLAPLFQDAPDYYSSDQGSAAYWLGRAYKEEREPEQAIEVWTRGLSALEEADRFDVRLADAFIRHIFEQEKGTRYDEAGTVYLEMLQRADDTLAESELPILDGHLEALAVVLPGNLREQTGLQPLEEPDDNEEHTPYLNALEDGVVETLLSWWRGQDTRPTTAENERLEDHLKRTVYAQEHYADRGYFDDRGRIYIQLGTPHRQTSVDFTATQFRKKVLNRNPTVNYFDYRSNEFWVYEHIDRSLHYLFVEQKRDYYEVGHPEDLLPSNVKRGFNPSPRGEQKGQAYVRSMVEVYRQLALYHQDYSALYENVAAYADNLDIQEFTGRSLPPSELRPSAFAQSASSESRAREWQIDRRRDATAPRSYSSSIGDLDALPLDVRIARFLEEGGTTRTEIYWSTPVQALRPSKRAVKDLDRDDLPERYMLSASVTQHTTDYEERTTQREQHFIGEAEATTEGAVLSPQTYVTRGDTGLYHIGVQWDGYIAYSENQGFSSLNLGPHIKSDTYRADSLSALSNDERMLEMSDLKPLLSPSEGALSDEALSQSSPYPFQRITPEVPLALYFEIYHLSYDGDDQTRYTVEYDVFRQAEVGGLRRLFQRDREERTTTQTTYTGDSRTAEEHILLDLQDQEAEGMLTVTVRITDENTGQQVERAISFDLADNGGPRS